jgi:hypothetical protein
MRVVGPFVRGALSTIAVLGGGFLIVVGVLFIAGGSDPWFGGTFVFLGLVSEVLGLSLLIVGVRGWLRLRRDRDLPPEPSERTE